MYPKFWVLTGFNANNERILFKGKLSKTEERIMCL